MITYELRDRETNNALFGRFGELKKAVDYMMTYMVPDDVKEGMDLHDAVDYYEILTVCYGTIVNAYKPRIVVSRNVVILTDLFDNETEL